MFAQQDQIYSLKWANILQTCSVWDQNVTSKNVRSTRPNIFAQQDQIFTQYSEYIRICKYNRGGSEKNWPKTRDRKRHKTKERIFALWKKHVTSEYFTSRAYILAQWANIFAQRKNDYPRTILRKRWANKFAQIERIYSLSRVNIFLHFRVKHFCQKTFAQKSEYVC